MPDYEKIIATKIQRLEREISTLRALEASETVIDTSDFVDKTNAQTIGGKKTFTTIPELPASDPASDNQAVRKGYVDGLFNVPSCRVYHNAAISIPHNTVTVLTFNSERWDTHAIHSTTSDTGKLVAPIGGIYNVFGNARFAQNNTGNRIIGVRLNGTTKFANIRATAIQGSNHPLSISTQVLLDIDDYVEMYAFQNSGGALNVDNEEAISPEFGMTWLRPLP